MKSTVIAGTIVALCTLSGPTWATMGTEPCPQEVRSKLQTVYVKYNRAADAGDTVGMLSSLSHARLMYMKKLHHEAGSEAFNQMIASTKAIAVKDLRVSSCFWSKKDGTATLKGTGTGKDMLSGVAVPFSIIAEFASTPVVGWGIDDVSVVAEKK